MDSPKLCEINDLGWRNVSCSLCLFRFVICPSCWRGQRYCSNKCKEYCKRVQHRKSQKKYSETLGFKDDRKLYQKQYREILKQRQCAPSENLSMTTQLKYSAPNVTDPTSMNSKILVTGDLLQQVCHFCHRIWSGDG